VKEFVKSVDIGEVMGKSRVSCFFLTHGVEIITMAYNPDDFSVF